MSNTGKSVIEKTSAAYIFSQVVKSAELIKSDNLQQFPVAASTGEYVRQGDVYITLIEKIDKDMVKEPHPEKQVAPGNTKGSRHILDSLEGVTVYKKSNATVLDGPVLFLEADRVLTHPEHGDFKLNAGCIYGITYQRMFAEELKRVLD